MSPQRHSFKCTLITNSSISNDLYSTQQQVLSECVCSPTFFLLLYKIDIMRKQVLILALNQPRKVFSSFHIREMGINQIYFDSLNALGACRLLTGYHILVGSQRGGTLSS